MGFAVVDITGQRFDRLEVLRLLPKSEWQGKHACWECRCECGTLVIARGAHLRSGDVHSCGCFRREASTSRQLRHGHSPDIRSTRTYNSWQSMKDRCLNPKSNKWSYYGADGITICQRWIDSFEAFLEDMGERPEGRTLDRIDPFGNYEPKNCRWATPYEQIHNRRWTKRPKVAA